MVSDEEAQLIAAVGRRVAQLVTLCTECGDDLTPLAQEVNAMGHDEARLLLLAAIGLLERSSS